MKYQGPTMGMRRVRLWAGLLLALGIASGVASEARAIKVYTAIGDSITMGYQVSTPWPARLAGKVGQTVYNRGVGGETTGAGLARIQKVINDTRPTHLFIMFGTNDVNGPRDLAGSARNIREMAQICRDNFVIPIVLTIPPFVGPKANLNSRVVYYNNLVQGAADAYDYFVVDVETAFGSGSGLMQGDGFHPNDAGQEVIANKVFLSNTPNLPSLPGKATQIAPSGEVTATRRPTFSWQAVSDATWYRILIHRDGKQVASDWTQATSWTPDFDLACASYTWWVMTWNQSGDGRWSNGLDFRYNGEECCFPDAIEGLDHVFAGGGAIEYRWDADACATKNDVVIHRGSQPWVDHRYSANPSGGVDGISVNGHSFGDYTFWVRGWSIDGLGAWSAPHSFTYGEILPSAPEGTITDRAPRFWWDDSASGDAVWYHVWINRGGTKYAEWWVERTGDTGTSGDFRYLDTPPGFSFKFGTYTWWVQAFKGGDYGPWSNGTTFSIPQETPGASPPVSPDGITVDTRRPTFYWTGVGNAEWYQFWLNRNGQTYYSKWFEGTSFTPTWDLPAGMYTWWIQTWNADGYGPWSTAATVEVPSLKPGVSNPLSPSGAAGGTQPELVWSAADGPPGKALWYYVYIQRGGGRYYAKWFEEMTSFTPPWHFGSGSYRWWVQTYNDYGYGPWSVPVDFTVP